MRPHPVPATLVLASGLALSRPVTADADGSLPPLPYRYVHPPPALASGNQPPSAGETVVRAGTAGTPSWTLSTGDGQATVSAPRNAFATGAGTHSIRVLLQPLAPPPGLPDGLVADGNAYDLAARALPANLPTPLTHPLRVTLRWPHLPVAMYARREGTWSRLCTTDQAVLTSSTMTCAFPALGAVVAATTRSNARVSSPPPTPSPWLSRYLPILAAASLVALAAFLGYRVTRPDKQSTARSQELDG